VQAEDFASFDLILAMDEQNLEETTAARDGGSHASIAVDDDYAPDAGRRAVPDPITVAPQGFEDVLDLLEQATEGLLRENCSHTKPCNRA